MGETILHKESIFATKWRVGKIEHMHKDSLVSQVGFNESGGVEREDVTT